MTLTFKALDILHANFQCLLREALHNMGIKTSLSYMTHISERHCKKSLGFTAEPLLSVKSEVESETIRALHTCVMKLILRETCLGAIIAIK